MNQQEAEKIIEQMKTGLAFSDEDMFTNEYWSFCYDREKKTFHHLTMWMVIGSVLSDIHYEETDALRILQSDFNYAELMDLSFQQESFKEIKGERPNDEVDA